MINKQPQKIYIRTFGCQMNTYDSTKIMEIMQAAFAMQETNQPENADFLVLNTCSVREKPQDKVFSELGKWNALKKLNPNLIIAVGGCVATQEGRNIIKRAPYVNIVFGPQTLHKLPLLFEQARTTKKAVVDTELQAAEKFANLPPPKITGPTAAVSIMEGCNKYCSYCIVPYTRGREVSRPFSEILSECAFLAEKGVKEITFLGQNVNDYNAPDKKADFAELLATTAKINGIERLRFMTSYPSSINNDLINLYKIEPKLTNHLHLPVQSGSDKILHAMRRRYTAAEYLEKIYLLKSIRPNMLFSADFIVGFPGETEEDFAATLDLVKEVNFDISYSFMYSPRPKTLAAKLPDDIPLIEKKRRLKILQTQLNLQAEQNAKNMVTTVQPVLIDGYGKRESQLTGRTDNNRVVNIEIPCHSGDIAACHSRVGGNLTQSVIPAPAGIQIPDNCFAISGITRKYAGPHLSEKDISTYIGKIVYVKIIKAMRYTLLGEIYE